MAEDFLKRLEGEILISDGAMGTMLQAAGLPAGGCPELWNVTELAKVQQIHKDYFDAGSDLALTNTFGGSRPKLSHYGLAERVKELNFEGVRRARMMAPENRYVALSVGPTGQFVAPLGSMTFEEIKEIFSEQIAAGAEGGADIICIETMSDISEARAAIDAAKSVCDLPIIATMTFDPGQRGYRTMMGVDPSTAAKALVEMGADVIGTNCGKVDFDQMAEIISDMKAAAGERVFYMAQANAGIPRIEGGVPVYTHGIEEIAEKLVDLLRVGINIVGGCCGTTPAHIRKFREVIKGA